MRCEVANVAGIVKYNRQSVFWHQNVGGGAFLFGGTTYPPATLLGHLCASSNNMSWVFIMAFQVYCGFMLFNMILTLSALCPH